MFKCSEIQGLVLRLVIPTYGNFPYASTYPGCFFLIPSLSLCYAVNFIFIHISCSAFHFPSFSLTLGFNLLSENLHVFFFFGLDSFLKIPSIKGEGDWASFVFSHGTWTCLKSFLFHVRLTPSKTLIKFQISVCFFHELHLPTKSLLRMKTVYLNFVSTNIVFFSVDSMTRREHLAWRLTRVLHSHVCQECIKVLCWILFKHRLSHKE